MHEEFTCEECGRKEHIRHLTHRDTQPGNYCTACGELEKCRACGEVRNRVEMIKQNSNCNYLCRDCHEEKMRKVCTLILQCNRWLRTESKKMDVPEYCILDTWLFERKEQWLERFEHKKEVTTRLQKYYRRMGAQLAMAS